MKITKLVLENVNSIYGKWTIDFTHKAFHDGIFAIIGPTGSGKTTLLDGICLALFGETPRLPQRGTIMHEVVSKGTNHCLAELTFQMHGKTYMASWGYEHMAQKRKADRIQKNNFHKLWCDGKLIEDKRGRTKPRIQEILGMNRVQFCRAVLLAQGQFNAFLTAGQDKAEILEQITGTEIYSRFGLKVHEKLTAVKDELKVLQKALESIRMLSDEEREGKEKELETLVAQSNDLNRERQRLAVLVEALSSLEQSERQIKSHEAAVSSLVQEQRDFEPQLQRLEQGLKASRVEPAYASLQEIKKEQERDQGTLTRLQQERPALEERERNSRLGKVNAEGALEQVRKQGEELEAVLAQVLPLDEEIRRLTQDRERTARSSRELERQHRAAEASLDTQRGQFERLEQEHLESEHYLSEHGSDAQLPELRAQWGEQLKRLGNVIQGEEQAEKRVTAGKKAVASALAAKDSCELEVKKVSEELQERDKALGAQQTALSDILEGKPLESWEEKRDLLVRNVTAITRILSFEDERKKLEDGKPCPLCGSVHHPYALGNVPELTQDKSDLSQVESRLRTYREAEAKATQLRMVRDESRERLGRQETALAVAGSRWEQACRDVQGLEEQLSSLQHEAEGLHKALGDQFLAASVEWHGGLDMPAEVAVRIERWQAHEKKSHDYERQRSSLETGIRDAEAQVATLTKSREESRQEQSGLEESLRQRREERGTLFGSKQPEEERKNHARLLQERQAEERQAHGALVKAETELQQNGQEQERLQACLSQEALELTVRQERFVQACDREGLTEESFMAVRLSEQDLTDLTAQRAKLEAREKELSKRGEELRQQREELRVRLPEDADGAAIRKQAEEVVVELRGLDQQRGEVEQCLRQNAEAMASRERELQHQKDLEKTLDIWTAMDELAGGNSGQRFRRLAQKITLSQLLRSANAKLASLNRRYELVNADDPDTLDIYVIDHCQGGERRPSSNLSGGEQFLVSLSLALGLSSLAGERIQVDSLFLDEGFGTLDTETLEQAINTLTQLQRQENKTIGIISHIQQIKESFPYISVIPKGSGQSVLCGQGVTPVVQE